jgi:hypothetical protein
MLLLCSMEFREMAYSVGLFRGLAMTASVHGNIHSKMARWFARAKSGLLKFVGQYAGNSKSDVFPGFILDNRRRSRSMKQSKPPSKELCVAQR